jgi:hypothetical protein
MKWSSIILCTVFMAMLTVLAAQGVSPWLTVPLGAFGGYWTCVCTNALWHVASYRIAIWRANLLLPIGDQTKVRAPILWWLANPDLDKAVDTATLVGVLLFPALLWLPLVLWVV